MGELTCRFVIERPNVRDVIAGNHEGVAESGWFCWEERDRVSVSHHRLKTFGRWRDRQLADGTVIWISPTGRTYRTTAAGADLFPPPRSPACGAPAPNRRSKSKQRASRIARARKHNREQRPINEARRRLEEARKEEIAVRKFRNHMRDMLFLFKGKPSTSPFCTWVNDPREPGNSHPTGHQMNRTRNLYPTTHPSEAA